MSPVISISLSVDFLWEIEESIKVWQKMNPNAKITRNMVVRHYIQRGIEYSMMLEKCKEEGKVIKLVELEGTD